MNIAVIGAGPIGGYAAFLFAKAGHKVDIYEEHATVGCPIQCTGLLTSDFEQFNFPKDSYLVNTFSGIEIFSPSGKKVAIRQKEFLVDRTRFDQFFVDMAKTAGASLYLRHAFVRKEGNSLIIRSTKDRKDFAIAPTIVIAADGPQSKTVKAYGFYHPQRQNFMGIQATVQGTFDQSSYQAFFGKNICPGLFA